MNLYQTILAIYSDLTQDDFGTSIFLQDDSTGEGPYIKEWLHTHPKPTAAQLEANKVI